MAEVRTLLAGRYRLLEQIDSGGSAYIYRAIDERTDEIIAVKILKPEIAQNKEFLDRFKKEVHASLKLRHANIIRAYDAGMDDGQYYIAMELIEGNTLKSLINMNGPLPLKYVVSVAKKLCLALEYAHVKGFVHRDIKPHNVMIGRDGEPYIADFGIAHDVSQNSITQEESSVMGSVHYFSPEQARGEHVDKRSDIYSLGIVMFEMLTGKVPFDADTSVAIALRHLNEPLPDIESLASGVPQSICRIINKATQKDKHFRYKNAFNMYEDLQRCLSEPDGEYVKYTESKRAHQADQHTQRSRLSIRRLTTVIVIGVALIVSVVGMINYLLNLNAPQLVDVPYVVGRTESEGVSLLEEAGLVVSLEREHSDEPEGYIIMQEPEEGLEVLPGHVVKIVVSSGQGTGVMPEVEGMALEKAKELLLEEGIINIEIIEDAEGETPLGFVMEQVPSAGVHVGADGSVTLRVKVSPDAYKVRVPDVTGINLENAVAQLNEQGFVKSFVYMQDGEGDVIGGTVISQEPAADAEQVVDKPVLLHTAPYEYASYTYTGSYTADITQDHTHVRLGVKGTVGDYTIYYIVYDGVMEMGRQEIPVDISMGINSEEQQVEMQLTLFIDDNAVDYENVEFEREG